MVQAKLHLSTLRGNRRQFVGESTSDHSVIMDDAEGKTGPKPIEFALLALGACTAFDVISILRKMRQEVTAYEVELSAEERSEFPRIFTQVNIKHRLHGCVRPQAIEKAIHLSETKYCSVGAMIGETAQIINTYEIIPEDMLTPAGCGDPLKSLHSSS